MPTLKGFSPVINQRCKILILGSMPGEESLLRNEYYAHARNYFWRIIGEILNTEIGSYRDKKRMLLSNRIALWDVVHQCTRQGSLDSNIKDIEYNDFASLFRKYSHITRVFCNGKKAYALFTKKFEHLSSRVEQLPSTSPANASQALAWKKRQWKKILRYI